MSKKNTRVLPQRALTIALVALAMSAFALAGGTKSALAAACTYSLSSNSYSVNEGEAAQIVVNETGSCSVPADQLSRTASVVPGPAGSATAGTDYVNFASAGANFPDNDGSPQSRVVSINTFEDGDTEPNEIFNIQLNAPLGTIVVGNSSAVVTIVDDDGPQTYSFSAGSYNFSENGNVQTVTVLRGGATGTATTVDCTVQGGSTATGGGVDYSVSDGQANFGVGATTATCSYVIATDNDTEPTETILLLLTNPSAGSVSGQTTTTINIIDDDGPGVVQFAQTGYTGIEGTTASFAVKRVGGTTGVVTATCATVQNGTALAGTDYTAAPVQSALQWLNGDSSDKFCQVAILADADVGSGETFGLTLASATLGSPTSATVTISDTSGTGALQFSQSSYSGAENGGAITVTVTRTGGSTGVVTVDLATTTVGSTATITTDYTPTSTTLTFADGDTSESWTISPVDDVLVEGTEFVNVVLTNPLGGATLGSPTTAQVNISDNESPLPVISVLSPSSGTILGGTLVTITGINLTGATLVTFGGFACTSLTNVNSTTLTCVTPARTAGTVEVVVTTPAGSNTTAGSANDYTYTGGPTVTSLSPNTGLASGATVVTITGTNFTSSNTVVRFDGIIAVSTWISSTTLVVVAPAHSAGTVDVIVTTPGGTSPNTAADDFTYTGTSLPVVSSLSPTSGGPGTTVIITGSGLTGATLVSFGGVAATYTVNSDGQITASVPAGTPTGSVDVRVTTPSGTSVNTLNDNFNNTAAAATVTYTLFFRFTLIVWTGPNNMSALAALRGLESPDNPLTNNVLALVGAVWRFDAATQTFKGYFPGSDGVPGANDFTTLTSGVGYFIALLNPGTVTWTAPGAQ